ncbi:DNA glycosylase [Hylemonella gracilis str. Niagara R]|uniref:DNA glycosylase n=1 Tax=Hylemonella gracilis str. Niagara R TaxID=1458275 RepID=A0A016XKW9_9BURK|nr:DNA-deoxyinosine glycosylase [Hylemonella gracilis]EYC52212.1 DNA glycosylase [Hylemonella gracilis str. Niagara R]
MPRLNGLAPIVGPRTRLLVLGSFPSVASLREQRYYAHPQNHFWKILQSIWPDPPLPDASAYEARCAWVLARGLGIWDVYASCEREGSLDSAIRNAVVNDFGALRAACPELRLIAHNGGESHKHAKHTAAFGLPVLRLPSTSPANASWSLERKRAAWRDAAEQAGLL